MPIAPMPTDTPHPLPTTRCEQLPAPHRKRGNPDLGLAPRCGAKTRAGRPCQAPAIRGKHRCRMHGGRSTGPRTPEGLQRLRTARTVHGRYDAETRTRTFQTGSMLRRGRVLLEAMLCFDYLPPALRARLLQQPPEFAVPPYPEAILTAAQEWALRQEEAVALAPWRQAIAAAAGSSRIIARAHAPEPIVPRPTARSIPRNAIAPAQGAAKPIAAEVIVGSGSRRRPPRQPPIQAPASGCVRGNPECGQKPMHLAQATGPGAPMPRHVQIGASTPYTVDLSPSAPIVSRRRRVSPQVGPVRFAAGLLFQRGESAENPRRRGEQAPAMPGDGMRLSDSPRNPPRILRVNSTQAAGQTLAWDPLPLTPPAIPTAGLPRASAGLRQDRMHQDTATSRIAASSTPGGCSAAPAPDAGRPVSPARLVSSSRQPVIPPSPISTAADAGTQAPRAESATRPHAPDPRPTAAATPARAPFAESATRPHAPEPQPAGPTAAAAAARPSFAESAPGAHAPDPRPAGPTAAATAARPSFAEIAPGAHAPVASRPAHGPALPPQAVAAIRPAGARQRLLGGTSCSLARVQFVARIERARADGPVPRAERTK